MSKESVIKGFKNKNEEISSLEKKVYLLKEAGEELRSLVSAFRCFADPKDPVYPMIREAMSKWKDANET